MKPNFAPVPEPGHPTFGTIVGLQVQLRDLTHASSEPLDRSLPDGMLHALRHQHASLGVNITLLEVQCECPPHWQRRVRSQPARRQPEPGWTVADILRDLVKQHEIIVREIAALLETAAGRTAALVLNEVSSRHREMLQVLASLGLAGNAA